jgi:hypothetical protein
MLRRPAGGKAELCDLRRRLAGGRAGAGVVLLRPAGGRASEVESSMTGVDRG